MEKPNQFWIRIIVVFVSIIVLVMAGRMIMLPESWGKYGYYRGAYINQEASKPLVHGENSSCTDCHIEIIELKSHSSHKRLSCESCHGPVSTHAKDGKKIADMPTRKNEAQIDLCLNCHQKTVGRPEKFPMIDHYEHLSEQNVKKTHTCDQCHTVHAPLENINHVKKLRTLREALDEK